MITLTPEREPNIRRSYRVVAVALLVGVGIAILSQVFRALDVPYAPV